MTENIAEVLARAAEEAEDAEERMERGELPRPPSHPVRPAREPAQVYSVRMPVERLEQLRQRAAEAGVTPSTLIRNLVLEYLDSVPEHRDQRARLAALLERSSAQMERRRTTIDTINRLRELLASELEDQERKAKVG